jgi:hypothetical protein
VRASKRLIVLPVAISLVVPALLMAGATPAYATPANDAFAAAQTISGAKGVTYGSLVDATIDFGTTCGEPLKRSGLYGDRSVWYRWTVPANGTVRFGMKSYGGWAADVDLYRNYGGCVRTLVAGASSAPGHIGSLDVERGESIWFGVYSFGDTNVGTFALGWRLIPTPPPLNDAFVDADVLWGRYGSMYANNINAMREAGEPTHGGPSSGHSAWFRWKAPQSGPAMFHVGGPARPLDCLLAVYRGTAVSALARVAADSGTWAGSSCTVRFTATAGLTYRIAVDGEADGSGDDETAFVLFWNSGQPPAHDDATSARKITGFSGRLDDTNRGATDEMTEPRHAPSRGGSSVWYRWTAPDDGEASFTLQMPYLYQPAESSEGNKRLAVFTGTPPNGLTLLAESPLRTRDLFAAVGVRRGTTYWIQVVGVDEQVAHYVLGWRLWPDSNDEFAEATVLPPIGSIAADTNYATAEPGEPPPGRYPAHHSLWFKWTAPQSGQVTFDDWEEGDGYFAQPVIAAYTGDRLDQLTRIPVTHQGQTLDWNTFTFAVTAGVTYRIALDENDSPDRHRLNWYFGDREWNDPAVTLTAPAAGARVSGVVPLRADASDDSGLWLVGFSHHSENGSFAGQRAVTYTVDFDTERYADGPLELTALASDIAANSAVSEPRTVVIENRPPAVGIGGSPDELTMDTNAQLQWLADEPIMQSLCSLDGAAYTDCSGRVGDRLFSKDYAGLADGVHVFRVIVTDMAGKKSVDPDAYQWRVDTKGLGVLLADDANAPRTTEPAPDITSGQNVGTFTAPVRMRWTSNDGSGTGIQRHDVERSVDGQAWTAVTSPGALTAQVYLLTAHTYRFRVRAWDWADNVSAWAYGPTFDVSLAQETATAWRWSTGWTRTASASASGGYIRTTGTSGAHGSLTFRGRSVAVYGPRSGSLGLSAIYLDGSRVATVNQWASSAEARRPLYIRNGLSLTTTHVLEVRSLGKAGHQGGGTKVTVDVASILH